MLKCFMLIINCFLRKKRNQPVPVGCKGEIAMPFALLDMKIGSYEASILYALVLYLISVVSFLQTFEIQINLYWVPSERREGAKAYIVMCF